MDDEIDHDFPHINSTTKQDEIIEMNSGSSYKEQFIYRNWENNERLKHLNIYQRKQIRQSRNINRRLLLPENEGHWERAFEVLQSSGTISSVTADNYCRLINIILKNTNQQHLYMLDILQDLLLSHRIPFSPNLLLSLVYAYLSRSSLNAAWNTYNQYYKSTQTFINSKLYSNKNVKQYAIESTYIPVEYHACIQLSLLLVSSITENSASIFGEVLQLASTVGLHVLNTNKVIDLLNILSRSLSYNQQSIIELSELYKTIFIKPCARNKSETNYIQLLQQDFSSILLVNLHHTKHNSTKTKLKIFIPENLNIFCSQFTFDCFMQIIRIGFRKSFEHMYQFYFNNDNWQLALISLANFQNTLETTNSTMQSNLNENSIFNSKNFRMRFYNLLGKEQQWEHMLKLLNNIQWKTDLHYPQVTNCLFDAMYHGTAPDKLIIEQYQKLSVNQETQNKLLTKNSFLFHPHAASIIALTLVNNNNWVESLQLTRNTLNKIINPNNTTCPLKNICKIPNTGGTRERFTKALQLCLKLTTSSDISSLIRNALFDSSNSKAILTTTKPNIKSQEECMDNVPVNNIEMLKSTNLSVLEFWRNNQCRKRIKYKPYNILPFEYSLIEHTARNNINNKWRNINTLNSHLSYKKDPFDDPLKSPGSYADLSSGWGYFNHHRTQIEPNTTCVPHMLETTQKSMPSLKDFSRSWKMSTNHYMVKNTKKIKYVDPGELPDNNLW